MPHAGLLGTHLPGTRALARWAWEFCLGYVYWLGFLLVLEPGNILGSGGGLAWSQETIRILGAALLGGGITPALLALVRRYPIEGKLLWRHALIQAGVTIGFAAGLILLSCLLAPLFLESERRPFGRALKEEMAVNGPLLVFCVAAFIALAHAMRFARRNADYAAGAAGAAHLTAVAVKSRGRVSMVELASIAWIETQGNYLALHVGTDVHLIREASVKFEARLDPERFVRIHRRTIVAVDRVRDIAALTNGDATLRLDDGTELRISRGFRENLRAKFEARRPFVSST
jgi:hypothetical protein